MNLEQFQDHLDRLGRDLDAWPEQLATAAHTLLARDPRARTTLAAATAVAEHLAAGRDHRAPADLAQRIASAVPASGPAIETRPPGRLERLLDAMLCSPWRPALLALVPLVAGFAIGFGQTDPSASELPENLLNLAFDDSLYRSDLYLELDDVQP